MLAILVGGADGRAAEGIDPSIIISLSGRYGDGTKALDRFEITDDGVARWDSASTGMSPEDPGCRNEGGRFEAKIEPQRALQIADAAIEAVKSQGDVGRPVPSAPRDTVLSVTVFKGEKSWSTAVVKETKEWKALTALVEDVKRSLLPRGSVLMRSRRDGKGLRITFDWFGDRPLALVLSKDPNEVFRAKGLSFKYEKSPPEEELLLSPKQKRVEVRLLSASVVGQAPEEGKGPRHLRYVSSPLLHHRAGDPLEGKAAPQSLDLCATYR